jgi:chromosome segregation ATPase
MSDSGEDSPPRRQQRPITLARRATELQQTALANRRGTLFKKMEKLGTKLAKLNNKISSLTQELTLVANRLSAIRERIHFLTIEINRLTQEGMEGNLGNAYARSRRHYDEYRVTNPNDREGIVSRYDESSNIHRTSIAVIQQVIRPTIEEAESALRALSETKNNYATLRASRDKLMSERDELQSNLDDLRRQDRELNIAHGKKQRRSRRKKEKNKK